MLYWDLGKLHLADQNGSFSLLASTPPLLPRSGAGPGGVWWPGPGWSLPLGPALPYSGLGVVTLATMSAVPPFSPPS